MRNATFEQQQARVATIRAGLEAAGYTLEHVVQHMPERYYHFQAPDCARAMIVSAHPESNGYRVSLYPDSEQRDYRRAKEVRADASFKPIDKAISSCCTASTEVLSNGYVDVKIFGACGHGEWVVEEKRVFRPEFRD